MLDAGAPFARPALRWWTTGRWAEASDRNRYSIVEPENLAAARTLADGHPFLSDGNGKFTLEIFELGQM